LQGIIQAQQDQEIFQETFQEAKQTNHPRSPAKVFCKAQLEQ
jgi:hypothetical protein